MNNYKQLVVFDYDGTLHDSIRLYGPAFRKAFAFLVAIAPEAVLKQGYPLDKQWTDQEISKWLGYSKVEMWEDFMPLLDSHLKEKAGKIIGEEMNRLIDLGHAKLYPNTLETLADLKEAGYRLLFLSNCSIEYMVAHKALFKLDRYFDDFYCAGQYPGQSKADILKDVLKSEDLSERSIRGYVVGDRKQDVETALENGFDMIACLYGFGSDLELEKADFKIDCIQALTTIL